MFRNNTSTKFSTRKILAIIPARGGSKSIPKKNIVPLAGKPLIAWTIEAALKSKYIDKVAVSSDSDEILSVGKQYGAQPVKRPAHLATDKAAPEPLVFQVMDWLKEKEDYKPDIIVYLQPTSPLRDKKEINGALETFFRKNCTTLISVYELEKKYLKTFTLNDKGFLQGSVNNKYPFMNRQELPNVYMPDGAIYIITRSAFVKTGQLFSDKTIPYFMGPGGNIDIDSIDDLKKVEKIIKRL